MDLAQMSAYLLERHTFDLFRMETHRFYDAASDGGRYRRWLDGDPVDPADIRGYLDMVRADTEANPPRRWRKVHVVRDGNPSDHERFECETWLHTVKAGEDVRILDVTAESRLDQQIGDFFVVDDEHVVLTHYDRNGRHAGAEVVHGREAAALVVVRDLTWAQAAPFTEWWAQHPHLHRTSTRAA